MFYHRRALPLLIIFVFLAKDLRAAGKEVVELSLRQFANMALRNSLRARSADEAMASNRFGWTATRRGLTWPSLSASATGAKSGSDSDTGVETETKSETGSLELSQPLLTGTQLSVEGEWSKSRTETDTLGVVVPSESRFEPTWTAQVSQPLYVFTGNESLRARREANLQWANDQDAHRREYLNIEFDARVLYYNLLFQMESAEVERRKFESSNLVTDTTRALVRAGKLAEVEMVRSDIRARKDRRQIQNSESQLEKSMNEARDLISLSPSEKIRLTSKLTYEPFTAPLAAILKVALENNPDVLSAKRAIESAEINLKRVKEGDNPDLNATGTYSLTRDRSDASAPVDPHEWDVRIGLDWPIFDASQTILRTRQSEIALKRARRDYEDAARDVQVLIQNTYLEIKRAEEQIADFGPQKESAERNVRAFRLQYRNGLTRLTDVFDAENQMRELDLEYLNLLVAHNTAKDRMKVLAGTDLDALQKKVTR